MEDRESCTALLSCPVCGRPLGDTGGSARCPRGHSFDYARSGYLNLARQTGGGGARVGDSAEMVRARAELLAAGHFERVAAAVADAGQQALAGASAGAGRPSAAVEVGCGTGYYLGRLDAALRERGERLGCGFGVDLSKTAASRAARDHPGLRFLVADVEAGIPLEDASVDLALSVFAPRPGAELGRVVRPGGGLVVALAGADHLCGLRERLDLIGVHPDKLERLGERLAPWFELAATASVEYEVALSAEDARRVVLMGPNARHDVDLAVLDDSLSDRVSVTIARFRRQGI